MTVVSTTGTETALYSFFITEEFLVISKKQMAFFFKHLKHNLTVILYNFYFSVSYFFGLCSLSMTHEPMKTLARDTTDTPCFGIYS